MKKLGPTVSKIRKDKNIPVQHLIHNCMSRSTYTRFIEGKIDLSASKFITVVHRLNMSLGEFEYIANGYQNLLITLNQKFQSAINSYSLTHKTNKLTHLRDTLYTKSKEHSHNYDIYFHSYCLASLLIERCRHQSLNHSFIQFLQKYLLGRPSWTYYEFSLLNSSSFYLNCKIVTKVFLKRILKDLKKYNSFSNNENEQIRLICNLILWCIYNKQLMTTNKLFKFLQAIPIQENMILEKLVYKSASGFLMIAEGHQHGFKLIQQVLTCFKITNPETYYPAIKNNYKIILKKYGLKDKLKIFNPSSH